MRTVVLADEPAPDEIPGEGLSGFDAASTLVAATEVVRRRRLVEVEDLQVLAHWAALHSGDPCDGPDGELQRRIGNTLKQLGGDGTPGVQDFCLGEIAMARGTGVTSTRNALADVLDLIHRFPNVWSILQQGQAEVWIARKVAKLSRHLPADRVWVVDEAIARILATEPGGRVIEVAEAKVIEADPLLHDSRRETELRRRYVTRGRVDECGLRTMIARLDATDAHWVNQTLERVAQILKEQAIERGNECLPMPEGGSCEISMDEWRAEALALLARPAELLALLLKNGETGEGFDTFAGSHSSFTELLQALRDADLSALQPKATLYVHLHPQSPVARVDGMGPVLTAQLQHLLARTSLVIKPVIDLALRVKTSAYEHPEALKERVRLTANGDYWPYGATLNLAPDYDHPTPYDHHGPPNQTGTHNSGPLRRTHHRWKTHAGYRSRQAGPGRYIWTTPHGLAYEVDQRGTRPIPLEHARMIIEAPDGLDLYLSE